MWEDARPLPHVGGGVVELVLGVTDPLWPGLRDGAGGKKYVSQDGQIPFLIGTNTLCNMDKYNWLSCWRGSATRCDPGGAVCRQAGREPTCRGAGGKFCQSTNWMHKPGYLLSWLGLVRMKYVEAWIKKWFNSYPLFEAHTNWLCTLNWTVSLYFCGQYKCVLADQRFASLCKILLKQLISNCIYAHICNLRFLVHMEQPSDLW